MTFTLKQGDTRIPLKVQLSIGSTPVDLTDCEVWFYLKPYPSNQPVKKGLAEIQDAAQGIVWYVFDATETAEAGNFRGEFEVIYPDNRELTFPEKDYLQIQIQRNLRGE